MQQLFGQKVLNDFIQKQDGFLEDIFENCLGYISKTRSADEHYTLEREKKNETKVKQINKLRYSQLG